MLYQPSLCQNVNINMDMDQTHNIQTHAHNITLTYLPYILEHINIVYARTYNQLPNIYLCYNLIQFWKNNIHIYIFKLKIFDMIHSINTFVFQIKQNKNFCIYIYQTQRKSTMWTVKWVKCCHHHCLISNVCMLTLI